MKIVTPLHIIKKSKNWWYDSVSGKYVKADDLKAYLHNKQLNKDLIIRKQRYDLNY